MTTKRAPITLSAYAKHRGISVEAVCKAVRTGRLKKSVTFVRDKAKITDAELADREWLNRTREKIDSPAPPAPPAASPTAPASAPNGTSGDEAWREARARQQAATAELAEIELAEKRGELMPAKDVEMRMADVFLRCRTRLLAVPARVREQDPTLSGQQLELIERLINEAIEELAAGPDGA